MIPKAATLRMIPKAATLRMIPKAVPVKVRVVEAASVTVSGPS